MADDRAIIYLNPRDLLPSRHNVRSDPGDLAGLAETIREHGILQPLGATRENDTYRVVYGNRRRDAAIVVGLDRVPCIVLDGLDDEDVVVNQVLENLQRLDLNDMDKSRAFEQLLARTMGGEMTQSEALDSMARTLGLSARQIQRYLRLRGLAPAVQEIIARGELGVTHAQHLAELTHAARQEEVAVLAVEESLSAAELSRLCQALAHNANIDPYMALDMLRRGERIATVEARPHDETPRFSTAPPPQEDAAPWDDDEDDEEEDGDDGAGDSGRWGGGVAEGGDDGMRDFAHLEPGTQDWNRVRKFHSLDAFMDELQRLTQCVQEGDLQRLMDDDPAADVKMRLATRQLRFLFESLSALVGTSTGEGPR
ncbi:MAG TPA: ParB/RepB/Spo0J family partition protein [Chloroflexi bacterium]|jgi:ParB family chromosome partitioning protein|nr:ParB/RepB/Spo0J family partition protein [Chloroflexota bacterium]